ncbi:sensor domain-containing diguanylate cyclase [Microvirga splendida]|uniref:diguanylate cyclase n=1 Tax=Microvirga splendida TaxID=2795727 RepID=A0ABS0Y3U8_9HYPH|nr:sensor domain-containing diguanylate cyclase [Microvirga splendida]MBJ6126981.1 sensor domain-containing diguanylate cyclase [Microvirga splendida]
MSAFSRIALKSSARGFKAFVLAVCLVIVSLEGWRDWSGRDQEIARINTETLNLAKSLTQHAQDSLEVADTLLVDVVDRIETGGGGPNAISRLDAFLVARVQSLQRIKSLTIYGEDGLLLSSSLPGHRGKIDARDQPFFQYHGAISKADWYLGPLIHDPLGGEWVVTLSRRINKPDGSFGGVAQVSIPPRYFANFFGRFDVGAQGILALFHTNGTLLSRYPYLERAIGALAVNEPWFREGKASGVYEYTSPLDGVTRIGGYQRNHIFPVGVLAAVGRDEALARWNNMFAFRIVVIGLLVTMIATLGWRFAGELRRRETAEAELAVLARTDDLTSLANRRTLDEQLEIEWLRAAREKAPVSLLMIDVDRFKAYNDTYGHQAGDKCLQIIASTIASSARRPSDLAARYGGEELAILLPELNENDAATVAEEIRSKVEALRMLHAANLPYRILTVSIGSATRVPSLDRSRIGPKDLISLADAALYEAKQGGRNRVAVAKTA